MIILDTHVGVGVEKAVLAEAATFAIPQADLANQGIYRARLIQADVQGSSGYYAADVLSRDGASAFPAGTHVYLDHPTRSDEEERPERSVREMAGVLLDSAKFEDAPDGKGLFARVQFFDDVKDMIKSRWQHVGLSIRASGEVEDTPTGRIVRSIREGLSVDVVTRPGAGGRLVTMTESAKPDTAPATPTGEGTTIPSTTGTGALITEFASFKESLSDKIEQQSIELARLRNDLMEYKRDNERRTREASEVRESLTFLRDRQEAADRANEANKSVGEVAAILMESGLPVASMVRVAKSYQTGQDIHEVFQTERDYAKKLLRESERGGLTRPETSMLGLTESATNTEFLSSKDEDMDEMDPLLSGKLY